jgi:hypothetical protein
MSRTAARALSRAAIAIAPFAALFAALLLAALTSVHAQESGAGEPPDYRISAGPAAALSADQSEVIVTFSVTNEGGPASFQVLMELKNAQSGAVVVSAFLPPLRNGETRQSLQLRFPVTAFPPGSEVTLLLEVGTDLDSIEEDAATIIDNNASVQVTIPDYDPELLQPIETPGEPVNQPVSTTVIVPLINFELNTARPSEMIIALAIGLAVEVMLIIVLTILLLILPRSVTMFSLADFITLLCAVGVLIAFFALPWQATVTFGRTGYELLRDREDMTLLLVVSAAIVAAVLSLLATFGAGWRRANLLVASVAGVVGLIYFGLYFIRERAALDQAFPILDVGFYTALYLNVALVLQVILPRPIEKSKAFTNWQPPYATMPPMDPNSVYGRRQAWQQHAQNNTLPSPCREGVVSARKVLLGMDGYYLSGWKVSGVRITQYDMYGRVARSQVLANPSQAARLNRIAQRASTWDPEKISRRVRPVARRMASQFRKKVSKRSAALAIALDTRLIGRHGEVRIVFELYQCQRSQLAQIDHWEPEMIVLGKAINESYTFTIYGQTGGETYNEFRRRLADDINRVLSEMLSSPLAVTVDATVPRLDPVDVNREQTEF